MKQRVTALDIAAIVRDIQPKLTGQRLQNVYNSFNKLFLFKFGQSEEKVMLLVESGIRLHTSQYLRDKAQIPSNFCSKLRKHLRNRRLTRIEQVGQDRVVRLSFHSDHPAIHTYHIILEFFAAGNVILLDESNRILALLRQVFIKDRSKEEEKEEGERSPAKAQEDILVGKIYQASTAPIITRESGVAFATTWPSDPKHLHSLLSTILSTSESADKMSLGKALGQIIGLGTPAGDAMAIAGGQGRVNPRKKPGGSTPEWVPLPLGEVIRREADDLGQGEEEARRMEQLYHAMSTFANLHLLGPSSPSQPGYLILASPPSPGVPMKYESFHSFLPYGYTVDGPFATNDPSTSSITLGPLLIRLNTMDEAMDQFFSEAEGQKHEGKVQDRGKRVEKKVEAVRKDQYGRINRLSRAREDCEIKAQSIESSLAIVEKAIALVKSHVDHQGRSWKDIQRDLKGKKIGEYDPLPAEGDEEGEEGQLEEGDPYGVLEGFKLERRIFTIRLPDPGWDEEDEEDEEGSVRSSGPKPTVSIDIHLDRTAYANARDYYSHRKIISTKEEKTRAMAEVAVARAEEKIHRDEKEKAASAAMGQTNDRKAGMKGRKVYWFEKFLWALTNEGFLCVGGKDAQQNELLVKRYLGKRDCYVHADLHGAATILVKGIVRKALKGEDVGDDKGATGGGARFIPPTQRALEQAGMMSVCQSKAWASKIPGTAYWVWGDQVSKTAPTGEYLGTGSFMIRGKRNFLPPVPLIYGYGLLWKVDKEEGGMEGKDKEEEEEKGKKEEEEDYEDTWWVLTKQMEEAVKAEDYLEGRDSNQASHSKYDPLRTGDGGTGESSTDPSSSDTSISSITDPSLSPLSSDLGKEKSALEELLAGTKAGQVEGMVSVSSKGKASKPRRGTEGTGDKSIRKGKDAADKPGSGKDGSAQAKGGVTTTTSSSSSKSVRGKKGKVKKAKTKYGNQDEEDRKVWMERLAPDRGPQPKGKKDKKKEQLRELWRLGAAQAAVDQQSLKEEGKEEDEEEGHTGDEGSENGSEGRMSKETSRSASPAPFIPSRASIQAQPQLPTSEDTAFLRDLRMTPRLGERLGAAIPICAPWPALERYKYKVKLVPGTLKKGKACQSAQHALLSMVMGEEGKKRDAPKSKTREGGEAGGVKGEEEEGEEGKEEVVVDLEAKQRDMEKELIKAIPDMEQISVMLSNSRVVWAGQEDQTARSGGGKGKGKRAPGGGKGKKK